MRAFTAVTLTTPSPSLGRSLLLLIKSISRSLLLLIKPSLVVVGLRLYSRSILALTHDVGDVLSLFRDELGREWIHIHIADPSRWIVKVCRSLLLHIKSISRSLLTLITHTSRTLLSTSSLNLALRAFTYQN